MPCPFRKLDIAVVPRYWGTMEHPGLLAMGQPLTLIDPQEDSIYRRRRCANIAVHELAHYWFGDYVTMAWWDETRLNEGLGTWMDQKITHRLEPSWGYDSSAVVAGQEAMDADTLLSANRVREPVADRNAVESSFQASTTYSKGAAITGMFERWVGEEAFRDAIRGYMRAHAWGNVTSEDLYGAFEGSSPGLGRALATFVDQPGVPVVSVELSCESDRAAKIALSQRRFLRRRPHPSTVHPAGGGVGHASVSTVLAAAARTDDARLFETLVVVARGESDRRHQAGFFAAVGWFSDPALVRRALDLVLDPSVDQREARPVLDGLFANRATREQAYAFIKQDFDAVAKRVTKTFIRGELFAIPYHFCDEPHRADAQAFLADRAEDYGGAKLVLTNALEAASGCIEVKRQQQRGVSEFFQSVSPL